jgi:nicotinamidase-related amidase
MKEKTVPSECKPEFGSEDLRLPDVLREPLLNHLMDLRERFVARGWGGRVGFGRRPAVLVIDLARYWLDATLHMGSHLGSVIEATQRVLAAARKAEVPVFFTTYAFDPADPPSPQNRKLEMQVPEDPGGLFDLDERLGRRPDEKIIPKRYASAFKGTNLHEMLCSVEADTVIVCGISTSHCVYASCRDAIDSFRVIVAKEAVGERCELMHEVNLLDIDLELGDVTPVDQVVRYLEKLSPRDAGR